MHGGADANETRIEVYVRSLRPGVRRPQRRALDRLDALAAAGDIAGYEVVVWGDRAPPSPEAVRTRAGRFVLDRVTVFQRWAQRNDASLEDAFGVRTVDSSITGETHAELVLPRLAAAAVRDGRLLGVAPATVDDDHRSVDEFIDELEAGAPPHDRSVEIRPLGASRAADAAAADDRSRPKPPRDADEATAEPDSGPRSSAAGAFHPEPTDEGPTDEEPAGEGPTDRAGDGGGDTGSSGDDEGMVGEDRGDPGRTPYPPY